MSERPGGAPDRFRTATQAEVERYTGNLYPLQDRIFAVASAYGSDLVLTGGTALARVYFHHRYSDDIDFFTLDPKPSRLGRAFAALLEQAGFTVDIVTASTTFMRMFVGDRDARIQVDIAPDLHRIESPVESGLGVFAHTLRDLGSNKISAFEDRSEIKDAIDLYCIVREIPWERLFADAEQKRIPIAYEDLQNLRETPLSGIALLTEPIAGDDFERFLDTLRNEIEREIKKKVALLSPHTYEIIADLLWDTPQESRTISERTRPVIGRRLAHLPLPQRIVVQAALDWDM